jgi:hypothetical protein
MVWCAYYPALWSVNAHTVCAIWANHEALPSPALRAGQAKPGLGTGGALDTA